MWARLEDTFLTEEDVKWWKDKSSKARSSRTSFHRDPTPFNASHLAVTWAQRSRAKLPLKYFIKLIDEGDQKIGRANRMRGSGAGEPKKPTEKLSKIALAPVLSM